MKLLKDYFYFTRSEIRGSLLLLGIILLIRLLGPILSRNNPVPTDFSALQALDSISKSVPTEHRVPPRAEPGAPHGIPAQAFDFDPNTAGITVLNSLGFKPWLSRRIERYRFSGARFSYKEDLLRIYGMDTQRLQALWTHILLPEKPKNTGQVHQAVPQMKRREPTDINTADTAALIALPGIGSKLAARICAYRDKLGGFYSLEQLAEVYGLKPETLSLLEGRIALENTETVLLDINRAGKETLGRHPYIGYRAAEVLLAYREQHGPFRQASDLLKTMVITEEKLEKLKYYLKF